MSVSGATMPSALSAAVAGIHAQFTRAEAATQKLTALDPGAAGALVEAKAAELDAKANMAVVKTAMEMQDTLLDMLV